jgi:hypothetical protein
MAKYTYNEKVEQKLAKAKKMSTLLPKGADQTEMHFLLLQIVAEAYGIKGYLQGEDN